MYQNTALYNRTISKYDIIHYITRQVCDDHVTAELLFPMDLIPAKVNGVFRGQERNNTEERLGSINWKSRLFKDQRGLVDR